MFVVQSLIPKSEVLDQKAVNKIVWARILNHIKTLVNKDTDWLNKNFYYYCHDWIYINFCLAPTGV